MPQQTAVQMLLRYIKQHGLDLEYEMEMSFLDHEKEQIIKAWWSGENDSSIDPKLIKDMAEQYYNEAYGK